MGRKTKTLETKGINCGIYIRVSTEEQKNKGFSPEGQMKTCRDMIKLKELKEIDSYSDLACSGNVPQNERKGFSRLLEDIKKGKINVILFQMFDRLARSSSLAYKMVDVFENYNIRMIECQHNVDSSLDLMNFKMVMGICFTFAEREYGIMKERSKNGTDSKKDKLGWIGGRVPFGYIKPNKDKDSIPIINLEEANTIKLIYHLYWNNGFTLQKICDYLIKENIIPGQYSNQWKPNTISRILKDHRDRYLGGLINDNQNEIRWGKILDKEYPIYPRKSMI